MIFKDHVQWPSNKPVSEEEKKKGVLSDLEEYALLEKELEEKIGHRWPVTIKWHPSKITRVRDNDEANPTGVRYEHPPFYSVRLTWVARGIGKDDRKHIWTYCENYVPNESNKQLNKYSPTTKDLLNGSGVDTFGKDDKEFLMWLLLAEPNLEGGKGATGSKNFLAFDLPHIDKKKNDEFDSLMSQVTMLINHPQYGKPIDELKMMLTSYFVPKVDGMEDFEVRAELKKKATEGSTPEKQMESMKLFLSRDKNSDGTKVRFLCQKAIEAGLIEYISPRKLWVSIAGGKEDKVLCKLQPDQITEKNQHLFETMAARVTPDHAELLQLLELRFMGKSDEEKIVSQEEEPEEVTEMTEIDNAPVVEKKKGNPNFGKKK